MIEEDVRKLISQGESESVEFRLNLPDKRTLGRYISAMANTRGGVILVGVDDEGRVKGIKDLPPHLTEEIYRIGMECDPGLAVNVEISDVEDKKVLVIEIPQGELKPYSTGAGEFYFRQGTVIGPMTSAAISRLVEERRFSSYEKIPLEEASLNDLDGEAVGLFFNRWKEIYKIDLQTEGKGRLLSMGFAEKKDREIYPTIAGMLLFGKTPQVFVPNSDIDLVRFQGVDLSSEVISRLTISGRIPRLIKETLKHLKSLIRFGTRVRGFFRDEIPEYPLSALQELITNAVVHRDYSLSEYRIEVHLFADRIEILSPGTPVIGFSKDGGVMDRTPRNPVISRTLRVLGYVEELGSGIIRVMKEIRELGLPDPQFEEVGKRFKVTLRNVPLERVIESLPEDFKDLNNRQREAIRYLLKNGSITNKTYRNLFNVSAMTAFRDLQKMVEEGVLVKKGEGRTSYYTFGEV